MFDKLSEFMGQGSRENDYRDFERRYQEDPDSISQAEAAQRYRDMMAHAPDDLDDPNAEAEYEQAFSNMSSEQRRELARQYRDANRDSSRSFEGFPQGQDLDQAASPRELGRMTRQAAQQDPNLLSSLLGGNSPLASPAGKRALMGLAMFAARRFLSRR